jgi:RimJ/RimL family protein N-acetyltransferase
MNQENLFRGGRIRLTAPRPDDVQTWVRWYEDSSFGRLFDMRPAYPRSVERLHGLLDSMMRSTEGYPFAIRLHENDALIGHVELDDVQWAHRSAWVSIAIGDPANRGLGYGTEALRLLLDFGFRELNLHRVQLTVFSYNAPAIRLYERLGFVREGAHREALLRDGERYDMYLYGLLAREWQQGG